MAVEIKICGTTNVEDARLALELGADYLGFIFYPKSPRSVSADDVVRILESLEPRPRAVGVFVNASREEVERTVAACGLYAAQLHGDEAAEAFRGSAARLWRAVRVVDAEPRPDPDAWPAERYLVDAFVPGAYGGTGELADWAAAAELAKARTVMLAGGLTPENVADAIRAVRPVGVDVASGVEAAPGRKDPDTLRRFIAAVRAVGR